jgi:hypothetical protein
MVVEDGMMQDVRTASWNARAARLSARAFLLVGMIGAAGAQSTMPDSQVEANVLKALASAPDLAGQAITTNTVYGVVTLSGTVQDDPSRVKAENLAANAPGVKKVVDELQVGSSNTAQNGTQGPAPGMVLQSDGTYAAAPAADPSAAPAPGSAPQYQRNDPDNDAVLDQQADQKASGSAPGQTTDPQLGNGQPQPAPQYPAAGGNGAPPAYPNYPGNGAPQNGNPVPPQSGYPAGGNAQGGYPAYPQNGYPQNGYPQRGYAQNGAAPWGGQVAGQSVVIPVGTMMRVRVNRLLASNKLKPGDVFDGFAANDVVAGGFVAIPRGAAVQGKVIESKSSGAISGRGELAIQLTSVTLGGKVYPLASDTWSRSGPDKTGQTVGSAAGFGVVGALIGAVAGRGAGAAIGAGVGAAAGVGASAASPKGQVIIPPEGMITFNLAQPVSVQTVSEQEIQRLAYGVPPGREGRQPMYARPYPAYGAPYPPPYGYPPY